MHNAKEVIENRYTWPYRGAKQFGGTGRICPNVQNKIYPNV